MACRKFDWVVSSKVPKTFEADQAAPGRHAFDPDVARPRVGLGAEVLHVVDVRALAGDRVGVEECLVAARSAAPGRRRVKSW